MQKDELTIPGTIEDSPVPAAAAGSEIPQDWSGAPAAPDAPADTAPLPSASPEGSQPEANIPKKKNKKKLIIILSVVGVVVIGAVIALILLLSPKPPTDSDDIYDDNSYVDVPAATRFNGVVEPQETVKVQRDSDLAVGKVFVEPGDTVKKGDKLFSYDSEEAKLNLELARLEYDGINNEITGYTNQISDLTKQRAEAPDDQKLDYTLQIQQAELSRSRSQMNLKQKKVEIDNLQKKVNTADVTSPIDGVIKSVSSSTGSSGESEEYGGSGAEDAFITILTTDSYRVKCSVDELNIGSLYEGMEVLVHSRADENVTWNGTISKIDTEDNTHDNNQNSYYDYGDSGESATKYTFYVTLDNAEGVLLGQHVYVEPLYDAAVITGEEDSGMGEGWDDVSAEVTPDKDER